MPKGWNQQAPPARQNDFRTFCMSDETEKVYHKLKEALSICQENKELQGSIYNFTDNAR